MPLGCWDCPKQLGDVAIFLSLLTMLVGGAVILATRRHTILRFIAALYSASLAAVYIFVVLGLFRFGVTTGNPRDRQMDVALTVSTVVVWLGVSAWLVWRGIKVRRSARA